jgi:osmoprotectant transport system substrate-binding protein
MRLRIVALVALAAALATGCAGQGSTVGPDDVLHDDAVTIGSFNFGESVLLAELYAQALEARGVRVERQFALGPRELVTPALERGLLELVPEYEGSLLAFVAGETPTSSASDTAERLRVALGRRGLVPLTSSPAQNQNGFAVTESFAQALGIRTLSDLEGQAGLTLGGPPECQVRALCERGLRERYGIQFESFVPLDQGGPLTADALARGVVDIALVFTTSPEIVRHRLVVLTDDRHLQPPEFVTPIVRGDTLERFGLELQTWIDAVSSALTTEELRAMNVQVELFGRTSADVAREWLRAEGLVPADG